VVPLADSRWPFRWDLLLRYRYIEIIALWEGRLTTRHLCETFGIGRQQASKDINAYLREVAPHNLVYDKHIKGYVPAADFTPRVTAGLADEYLQLAARNNELANVFESLRLGTRSVEVLSVPVRDVEPATLRPILQAARQHQRIDVDYVSITQPDREGRIIVPHTLVYTGLRWHVRAWCEKNQGYRDFVLSRFRGEPEPMDLSTHDGGDDHGWHTRVPLRLVPDPRLDAAQRAVVEADYGMTGGELVIETRGCLLPYVLQRLQLRPGETRSNPAAQQIAIGNRELIDPWLFPD
jgi:predicted DNA-binding transcriptional regulator YafY